MKKKAKQKTSVKSDDQDGSSLSGRGSGQVKVAKKATKAVVKEEIPAEVSVAAEVCTPSKRNREHKQPAMKRKRSSSEGDSAVAQRQDDSAVVHDAPPSRKRKTAAASSQQQEKCVSQSVDKRRPSRENQHPTRTRKPTSVQKKKADKEQLESAVVSDVKKSTKVKRELPSPVSAVKAVDKMSVKTEQPDVACTSPPQHSGRKFIGAHVSIGGMTVCYLFAHSHKSSL